MANGLQELRDRYDELRGQVERGEISVESASAALEHICVTDAAGYEWLVDPYGTLLRRLPGQAPTAADPDQFASFAAAPVSPGAPQEDLLIPPVRPVPARPEPHPFADAFKQKRRSKERSGVRSAAALLAKLGRFRGLIVVGLCLAVIAALLLRNPDETTPGTASSTSAASETTAAPASTETTAAPTPVTPTRPEDLGVADATAVLEDLASAERPRAAKVAPASSDEFQTLLRAAQYAGYRAVGLGFAVDKVDVATFVLSLRDGEELVTKFVFRLVISERGTVLAAWPEPLR